MHLSKIIKLVIFHVAVNVLIVFFISGASYYHIPLSGFKDHIAYLAHLILLQTTFAGIIYFLSLNRYLFSLVFSLLFLILGIIGFWVYSIDLTISSDLINASLQSKFYIIKDLLSWQFFFYITALLTSIYFILKFYAKINPYAGIRSFSFLAISSILLFFFLEHKKPTTFKSKLPYVFFYSLFADNEAHSIGLSKPKNIKYFKDSIKLKVVFVVGESVRPDHLGINGYDRSTTPMLSKRTNLISKTIFTNKTYTAASLKQMLTNLSIHEDRITNLHSVFDVLREAKVQTDWIGNQLLEDDYAEIAKSTDSTMIIDELKSSTSYHKEKDEKLLPFIIDRLALPNQKHLITVHMIGSHWWYESRYPEKFRKFKPVIDSKYQPALSEEQLINSYDNTLLYTDFFLNEIITRLENIETPTLLLFVSDHGESLGENGKWLHAFDSPEIKNTALIAWYSEAFRAAYPEKIAALLSQHESSITMDAVYYTLEDLFDIQDKNLNSSILKCEY